MIPTIDEWVDLNNVNTIHDFQIIGNTFFYCYMFCFVFFMLHVSSFRLMLTSFIWCKIPEFYFYRHYRFKQFDEMTFGKWPCQQSLQVSFLPLVNMADLTAFSNKSFNSTAWINAAMKDSPDDLSLEAYISSLSTKLHIMSQDYTDQLETAMVESMSTMPRIILEISKTEDQLRSVEAEMKSLSLQLNSFDQRNVAGVEDLSRLDTLKTNMEKCKATLEEHARWSQLVREAKSFLEGGGRLSDSADR